MATILIIIIYIAFVSLGLPDALVGAVWPAAHADFGMPLTSAGIVSFITVCGTVLSSLLSARIIKRLGTGRVAALSAMLTGGVIIVMSVTHRFLFLCLLAVPLGFGAGSVDTALNSFVALHYKASHMSFLHAAWGLGATVGPLLLAQSLSAGGWRGGYRLIGSMQLGFSLLLVCSLPLWKRFAKADAASSVPIETSYRKALRLPMAAPVLVSLFCYCAAEIAAGLWAASFFVSCVGLSAAQGARAASLFYLGMLGGRLVSGFIALRVSARRLISIGQLTALCGAALMLVRVSPYCAMAGLLLAGLGCAPIYPSMLHETPKRFGASFSQTMIGLSMATAYTGSAVMPPLLGLAASRVTLWVLPAFIIASFLVQALLSQTINRQISN